MLNEHGIAHTYREYTQDPLAVDEIRRILVMLDCAPRQVLRRNDRAYRELGLTGKEPDEVLVQHLAEHPTLLQRPIGIVGDRAAVGRPPENLLELLG